MKITINGSMFGTDGYSATKVLGYHYENGDHTCSEQNYDKFKCKHYWVILKNIPIDAVSGEIISPKNYFKYYQEI